MTFKAAKEAFWVRKFISELGVVPNIVDPIPLYCDKNGAIAQGKEPQSHQRSKHLLKQYQLIREIIGRHDVIIEKVSTDHNIADPLTKPLPKQCLTLMYSPMVLDIKVISFRSSGSLLEKCSKGHHL